ncbi:MAG TPA: macro domain-containing protein [Gemmatimonadales bacterium]|nr:macro domain-containing protein [Gemmatimonadales bacterium]
MIRVVVDDLAFCATDAILRPADAALEPITPAVARLDSFGGETFRRQRRVQSPLEIGAAVVTGAGDLPAEFVIHLVLQDPATPASPAAVRKALVSAWQRAGDWGLRRIAAPLVGAGPGLLGTEESAELLARTFAERRGGAPESLTIVVEREDDRAAAAAVVGRIVP